MSDGELRQAIADRNERTKHSIECPIFPLAGDKVS
jgi:hypothetical protein